MSSPYFGPGRQYFSSEIWHEIQCRRSCLQDGVDQYALQNLEIRCDVIISCARIIRLVFNYSHLRESPQNCRVLSGRKYGFTILIQKNWQDWGFGGLPPTIRKRFWSFTYKYEPYISRNQWEIPLMSRNEWFVLAKSRGPEVTDTLARRKNTRLWLAGEVFWREILGQWAASNIYDVGIHN